MRTFHRLVANTLVASVTNNFIWFALTFWVYLETRSVIASSVIAGGYMLLLAVSGLYFGTFVDRHRRKTSMMVSSLASLGCYLAAGALFAVSSARDLRDLGHPAFWGLIMLLLAGAIAGNLRAITLSTTVTLLVPAERHAQANGLVGTANGVAFALTSVFSGLAIGLLGMGPSVLIGVVVTGLAAVDLLTIRVDEPAPAPSPEKRPAVDLKGALGAVRTVPGLLGLLFFSTFNNFLAGVFMALIDPYGLNLVSVETWGIVLAITSSGFIVGGLIVARRGLGDHPVRALLVANLVLWCITIGFPLRSSILLLAVGFCLYTALIPVVEAAEQTVIQRVVPFAEQGRVFGFAQSVETAASPITTFLVGPIAQLWVIPFMVDGAGAEAIGSWFGTGPDRGMALMFIASGVVGLLVTLVALRSRTYRNLSAAYALPPVAPASPPSTQGVLPDVRLSG